MIHKINNQLKNVMIKDSCRQIIILKNEININTSSVKISRSLFANSGIGSSDNDSFTNETYFTLACTAKWPHGLIQFLVSYCIYIIIFKIFQDVRDNDILDNSKFTSITVIERLLFTNPLYCTAHILLM